jgi:hypothetical protein
MAPPKAEGARIGGMTLRLASISIVCLAMSGAASAMSMNTRLTPLAFNDEGTAVLVRADVNGPEGGGQQSFEIWASTAPYRTSVTVSSDLSPGNGSKPQTVTAEACATALKELDGGLRAHGFKGVSVHADRCAKRHDLVSVDAKHTKDVGEARFKAKGNALAHEGIEVRFRGKELAFYRDESKMCALMQPKRETPTELSVWGAKGGKLVYVIETRSSGDMGLLGMCGADADGKLQLLQTDAK